jgi:hypothetical protein
MTFKYNHIFELNPYYFTTAKRAITGDDDDTLSRHWYIGTEAGKFLGGAKL